MQSRGHAVPDNPDLPWWVDRDLVRESGVFFDAVNEHPSPRLLLLKDANDRLLDRKPMAEQLHAFWRLLFQAAVLKAIDAEALTSNEARQRLGSLSEPAAREIRVVLEADHIINPATNDYDAYRMFAMICLDLQHFAPDALRDFFPSLPDTNRVVTVLPVQLNVEQLLRVSRPPGAPDHVSSDTISSRDDSNPPSASTIARDLARAEYADRRGNHVRAAILYARLPASMDDAVGQIVKLVARLGEVCDWGEMPRTAWSAALSKLLPAAAHGEWSRAARCLYELQKIALDLRGQVYAVDVIEWARSLGRRSIKRPLPLTRNVIRMRNLRAAVKQLAKVELSQTNRSAIDQLLHLEIHRVDGLLREELSPLVVKTVEAAGFVPTNMVERVARDKLAAELLDRICERGYLRIGDLRDAVARNQLKMPDLAGPGELVFGDALLRTDTRLVYELDGVYRRGELYLRLIHRFSSIFFGTPWGRWLTLFVIIPFGGAFMALMAAEELRHIGGKVAGLVSSSLAPPVRAVEPAKRVVPTSSEESTLELDDDFDPIFQVDTEKVRAVTREVVTSSASHPHQSHSSPLIEPPVIIGVGLFLLLMLHVPAFRSGVFTSLRALWNAIRLILHDGPITILRSPPVRLLLDNAVSRFVVRYLGGAIVLTAFFVLALAILGASSKRMIQWGTAFFVISAIIVNTRFGWLVQDRVSERFSDSWRILRVNLIPGFIAGILDAFRALADWFEQKLYAVDESLRFREGDSQGSFVLKALIGLVWFPFAYAMRFLFYLLIEPQVNPVKHFPVVTVSHKVIWPMVPTLAETMGLSELTVGMFVNGVPGIFGFMAWELKENWRLYRANRPDTLRPVLIGSHGESMRRLLRPGFHSGTVPKALRKLRRAQRKNQVEKVHRFRHELEHVAEAVHRFAERDLAALLKSQPEWQTTPFEVREVSWGCRRLCVAITLEDGPLELALECVDGNIVAVIENASHLKRLDATQSASLHDAISGFFNLAAASSGDERWACWPRTEWVKRWKPNAGKS